MRYGFLECHSSEVLPNGTIVQTYHDPITKNLIMEGVFSIFPYFAEIEI